MKRILAASLLASVIAVPSTAALTNTCKDWHIDQDWKVDQIDIAYIEPSDSAFRPIYEGLKRRKVLEELAEFLSPLRLPQKVLVKTEQCDAPGRPYQPGGPVTICYEYVAKLVELAQKIPEGSKTARGVSRDDAIVGAFVQVVLQEMADAVLSLDQVPVWGREDDAADKFAGFLMLQFGSETARKLLNGAAYFFEASDRTWTGSDFSSVQSTEAQRFYNYLCIAYGGDPVTFKNFVQVSGQQGQHTGIGGVRTDLLPARRVPWCSREYNDFKFGFDNFIRPCVDRDRLEKVRARQDWLQSENGK
jgi:Putative metallopeptidase